MLVDLATWWPVASSIDCPCLLIPARGVLSYKYSTRRSHVLQLPRTAERKLVTLALDRDNPIGKWRLSGWSFFFIFFCLFITRMRPSKIMTRSMYSPFPSEWLELVPVSSLGGTGVRSRLCLR